AKKHMKKSATLPLHYGQDRPDLGARNLPRPSRLLLHRATPKSASRALDDLQAIAGPAPFLFLGYHQRPE
ncbi:MAG TPA: hypothetical protein VMS23_08655, partial [Terrimicrobiaceae bacterium]|nr:hypothetical protein [Terrimicrobiaceae bacterium]